MRFLKPPLRIRSLTVGLLLTLVATLAMAQASPAGSVRLEDLTWTEVAHKVDTGTTTILIPVGGTEQSGPYMALGKHNVRAGLLSDKIATQLGNALVAPVLAYVPEGDIHPPQAHMRFSGTISIAPATFEALLEDAARSFKQHGFHNIVLLGDHGGYQKSLLHVAAKLNREWANDPRCRVLALTSYYDVTQGDFVAALKRQGFSAAEIGTHAGLADTALSLALDPTLVRRQALVNATKLGPKDGVYGDPRRATVDLGQIGVQEIVQASVADIQAAVRSHP